MDTGDLLKAARIRAGLSQSDLAIAAETAQPAISAYERGHRDPSLGTLRRLLSAAGTRLDVGLSPVSSADVPPATDDRERAARLVDVLLLADAIPPRDIRGDELRAPRMVSR